MRNGKDRSDPLAATREAIAELEGSAWEEEEPTGQTYVHAAPGSTVVVEQTGKFKAIEPVTRLDNPAPPSSVPPRVKWLTALLNAALGPLPGWGRVLVLLALIGVLGLAVDADRELSGEPVRGQVDRGSQVGGHLGLLLRGESGASTVGHGSSRIRVDWCRPLRERRVLP